MPSQAQYNETNVLTRVAGTALPIYRRVKYGSAGTAGQMILATAAETGIGCTERPAFAQGALVPVRARSAVGTVPMVAISAIALGADVYAAADGKIDNAGTVLVGSAEQEATADGDIIEVLRV